MVNNASIDSAMQKKAKRRISLTLNKSYVEALDKLVKEGIYLKPQVAIRDALRLLFRHHRIEPFYSTLAEKIQG